MIFDDKKREDTSPKRNQEGEFAFLNRSDRPEIARVRELIESASKTILLMNDLNSSHG